MNRSNAPDGRYFVAFSCEVEIQSLPATGKAVGLDLGVKDVVVDSDGWKRLKEYFEVAARYNDGHWRIPGYLDGVKLKNQRVPQPGQSGIQWCGIFATWVWIKAGVPGVYWASPGIKGPGVKIIAGFKGIGLGDIGVQAGSLVHHFIISKLNDPPDKPGATVETINGNSTYQGITTISRPLSAFSYYYTLDSGFFGVLQKMYGE